MSWQSRSTRGPNETVAEDSGPRTVNGWATAISRGPADEAGQSVSFHIVSNSNPSLFSAGPAVSSGGALTFTPGPNRFGTATIGLRLKDSGGTANGGVDTSASQSFTITVAPVNDPPTATDDGPLTVGQNAGPTALAVLANDTASPDSGETLTIVAKTDGAHGSVAIVAGGAGVTYAPGPLFRGTDSFTYTVSDGGLTDTATVTVSVVQTGSVSRLAGADRYATAAAISAATFAPGVPVAYVATGLNFPDALAGAAAGGHRGGPVLLIDPNRATLPAATAAELVRLKPKSIVALGSSAVVPAAIVSALAFYTAP